MFSSVGWSCRCTMSIISTHTPLPCLRYAWCSPHMAMYGWWFQVFEWLSILRNRLCLRVVCIVLYTKRHLVMTIIHTTQLHHRKSKIAQVHKSLIKMFSAILIKMKKRRKMKKSIIHYHSHLAKRLAYQALSVLVHWITVRPHEAVALPHVAVKHAQVVVVIILLVKCNHKQFKQLLLLLVITKTTTHKSAAWYLLLQIISTRKLNKTHSLSVPKLTTTITITKTSIHTKIS